MMTTMAALLGALPLRWERSDGASRLPLVLYFGGLIVSRSSRLFVAGFYLYARNSRKKCWSRVFFLPGDARTGTLDESQPFSLQEGAGD